MVINILIQVKCLQKYNREMNGKHSMKYIAQYMFYKTANKQAQPHSVLLLYIYHMLLSSSGQ